jgi:hypothetical protein
MLNDGQKDQGWQGFVEAADSSTARGPSRCGTRYADQVMPTGGLPKIVAIVVLSAGCRETPPARPVESPAAVSSPTAAPRPETPAVPPADVVMAGLPVPFESEGACPFECCVYRTWSVERPTDVRTARDTGAPTLFTVQPGDTVEALTGVVVVSTPGRARAARDVQVEGLGAVRSGEEVAVLHPLGEGFWLVWREGRKGSAQVGPKSPRPGPWDPELNPIARPEFAWWVRVRDGRGRTGWTEQPGNFGDNDRCA